MKQRATQSQHEPKARDLSRVHEFVQARVHHPRCIDALAGEVHRRLSADSGRERSANELRRVLRISSQVLNESALPPTDTRLCTAAGAYCSSLPHRFQPDLLTNGLKLLPATHEQVLLLRVSRSAKSSTSDWSGGVGPLAERDAQHFNAYLTQALALLRALAMRSPAFESAHTVIMSREELFAAQEAAEWLFGSKLAMPHEAFSRWLSHSPVHVREMLLARSWRTLLTTSQHMPLTMR